MKKQKVVILFTRLSDYMLNVFCYWVKKSKVELYIFRRRVDIKQAPFKFNDNYKNIYLFNEDEFPVRMLINKVMEINPTMILCAGWMDKRYLKVVRIFSGKIPTVMSMDTQWHGKPKQYIARIASRLFLKNIFSFIWVPGEPQVEYAKKLGFQSDQILFGFYVANRSNCSLKLINPKRLFKKRFIYVGRYIEIKGIKDLWQAFIEFQEENPSDWELYCIGTGPLFKEKKIHPQIKHIGFVQPAELKHYLLEGGIFVMPSHYEPWGVVVHEFALAGFPMIVANAVGAASVFVDDTNGIVFKSGDVEALKQAMIEMSQKTKKVLSSMGAKSHQKALQINEDEWIKTANKILCLKK